jgi:3-deoxy-D-manno-octulosonate 8-phosphate phosphatase (KDO 8-P phosphatase)
MSYLDHFKSIKAFVFDVDGVLTNGSVVLLPDGQQMRQMHSKDGYALQLALKKGYKVAVITGGGSVQVKDRLNGLGVNDTYMNVRHKDEAMADFIRSFTWAMISPIYALCKWLACQLARLTLVQR